MERPLDTLTLSCACPTAHVRLTSELHCAPGSFGFTPDALSRRAVGGPPGTPTLPQLPRTKQPILGSFQPCSAAVNIALVAVGQGPGPFSSLAGSSQPAGRRSRDYVSWAQSERGRKQPWGSKKCCQGSDGSSLSCFLSCDG